MTVRTALTADASFANRRECGPSSVGTTSRNNPAARIKPPIIHNRTRMIRGSLRLELSNGIAKGPPTIERCCCPNLHRALQHLLFRGFECNRDSYRTLSRDTPLPPGVCCTLRSGRGGALCHCL